MPHDKNGKLLQVGDEVILRCKITSIAPGEDYCNISMNSLLPLLPGIYPATVSCNASQVELAFREPEPPIEGHAPTPDAA